jgi:hypothetical protein
MESSSAWLGADVVLKFRCLRSLRFQRFGLKGNGNKIGTHVVADRFASSAAISASLGFDELMADFLRVAR